jgi:hypothetical protein
MMGRSGLLAVMAVVGIALGGCGDEQPSSPLVAEPETVGRVPGQTTVQAVGEAGWMAGPFEGLVTKVSRNTNGHFVTVGKDADGGVRRYTRGKRCTGMVLGITGETRVLRGPGGDTPASASDIEEGQRVRASPGDDMAGPCPPLTGADEIVILGGR